MIVAAYECDCCGVKGRDAESRPGVVHCWQCGEQATITARVLA